ncbi:MAG: phosphotransferase [Syntrophaceae bacterium]|nr:phosphotransferase [Syntrophaceae bacterium]
MTTQPPAPDPDTTPWGLRPRRSRPDLIVAGSPERVLSRLVLEDENGSLWILEEVAAGAVTQKERQAEILDRLSFSGLKSVHPYLRDRCGSWIACGKGSCRMLRPFLDGDFPERPGYAREAWRGEALGTFLAGLRRAAHSLPPEIQGLPFSLETFVGDLLERIRRRDPAILPELSSAVLRLRERLFPVLARLPSAFCHGDFHPLNAIWSQRTLKSVIDWEFCGPKTEAFDAALLMGCIGMEDPQALTGSFIPAFLAGIRRENLLSPASLSVLFELVLAVRFLWLSEWLRGRDMEMARLELDYMDLLLSEESLLREAWELPR